MTLAVLGAPIAGAQERAGVIITQVIDGRDGSPIASVDVRILATTFAGRTDSSGTVALRGVPSGRFAIEGRRPGFAPTISEIQWPGSDTLQVVLILRPAVQTLPTVNIVDSAVPPELREFESRRRNHAGGFFIDQAAISKYEGSAINVLLEAKVPGIRPARDVSSVVKVYSTRGSGSLKSGGGTPLCQVEVFLNGIRLSDGDAGIVPLQDLGGIEYYAPGFVPVQYRIPARPSSAGGGTSCGVLLLWTRP
jgi:hypothetical protein